MNHYFITHYLKKCLIYNHYKPSPKYDKMFSSTFYQIHQNLNLFGQVLTAPIHLIWNVPLLQVSKSKKKVLWLMYRIWFRSPLGHIYRLFFLPHAALYLSLFWSLNCILYFYFSLVKTWGTNQVVSCYLIFQYTTFIFIWGLLNNAVSSKEDI